VQDPIGRTGWPKEKGRDGERTPKQRSEAKDAGFSTAAKTWPPEYKQFNVADEERDPNSLLSFYKQMLRLRRENAALREGDYEPVDEQDPYVLSFLRSLPGHAPVIVALNHTAAPEKVNYGQLGTQANSLLRTFAQPGQVEDLNKLTLPPFGVFIGQVQSDAVQRR
jgi:alpha-glucosidase